ncbi:MAG: SRPBCC family protein [Sediminibacterium sp.]|nr:SRPBCC family protein [Sediminibacterium sp.]
MLITLILLGGLILTIGILHFVMGSELRVENNIEIKKPVQFVFDFVRFTKNQDLFSVWNMTDPNMKKTYEGTDGEKGFIYKWDSTNKNVGAGEQKTIAITNGKSVHFELTFIRPMESKAKGSFTVNAKDAETTLVTWTFEGTSKFPMTVLKPLFKSMLGKSMNQSLQNLKALLEK